MKQEIIQLNNKDYKVVEFDHFKRLLSSAQVGSLAASAQAGSGYGVAGTQAPSPKVVKIPRK